MRLGRLFGIPLRVDWSWLLTFGLLVWTLSTNVGPFGAIASQWRVPVVALSVLLLFACVIAHEFAHAWVARSYGIQTREIVLFVFGGVSRMERVGIDAWSEAKIAIAGPLASLVLGLVFGGVVLLLPTASIVARICASLAAINVVLALFNLLPAFPVDGGRIVHAIAWAVTRSRLRAMGIARTWSMFAGGVLAVWSATLLFAGYTLSGVWGLFIAWFIMQAAQAEYVNETEIEPLKALSCGELADPPGETLAPEIACDAALEVMAHSRRRAVPVASDRGLIGLLTLSDFAKVRGGEVCSVATIMTPVAQLVSIAPQTSALEALEALTRSPFHQLPVIDAQGELLGLVSVDTIRRAVAFSMERARLGIATSPAIGEETVKDAS